MTLRSVALIAFSNVAFLDSGQSFPCTAIVIIGPFQAAY